MHKHLLLLHFESLFHVSIGVAHLSCRSRRLPGSPGERRHGSHGRCVHGRWKHVGVGHHGVVVVLAGHLVGGVVGVLEEEKSEFFDVLGYFLELELMQILVKSSTK